MDWNRMRDQWQSPHDGEQAHALGRPGRTERLWQQIRRRDAIETLVAVPLVLVFGVAAVVLWMAQMPLPAIFAAWLAASCVAVAVRLARARALFPKRESDLSLRRFLAQERHALQHQHSLLSSVLVWYVAPLLLGAFGLFAGIRGLHWQTLAYAVVVLAIGYIVVRLNRFAVEREIEPAIRMLDEQIRELEEEDES